MRISWAEWRGPIYGRTPNGFEHPSIGVVLHIMGSSTQSADNWFHSPKSGDPQHGAGADFGICNGGSVKVNPAWVDGHLIQWADLDDRAWAQGAGNRKYWSIETEGSGGPLTDAQVATCARLYRELEQADHFGYALSDTPGQLGFGWHGMGGAAWGGHDYCPGPERKAQRSQILKLAQAGSPAPPQEDDDMPGAFSQLCPAGSDTVIPLPPPHGGAAFTGVAVYVSFALDYTTRAEIVIGAPNKWRTVWTDDKDVPVGRKLGLQAQKGDEEVVVHNRGKQPITALVEWVKAS